MTSQEDIESAFLGKECHSDQIFIKNVQKNLGEKTQVYFYQDFHVFSIEFELIAHFLTK